MSSLTSQPSEGGAWQLVRCVTAPFWLSDDTGFLLLGWESFPLFVPWCEMSLYPTEEQFAAVQWSGILGWVKLKSEVWAQITATIGEEPNEFYDARLVAFPNQVYPDDVTTKLKLIDHGGQGDGQLDNQRFSQRSGTSAA